jgi:hypothetical protein
MSSKNVIDLRKGVQKPPPPRQDLRLTPERPARLQSERSARVSPIRKRRRRTRYIILGVLVVLIALVTFGISWVSYLPRYSVESVTIVGTDQVPSQDVYDYVESLLHTGGHPFLSKDNIFLYNPKAIAREVVGYFPRIAMVTVSRASLFSNAITVTVTEREPYALWCSDSSQSDCYEMDQTGFIFEQAPPGSVPAPIDATDSASTTSDTATSTPSAAVSSGQTQQYIFEGGLGMATSTADATSSVDVEQASSSPDSSAGASTTQSFIQPADPIGYTFVGAHMPGIVALLQILGQAGFTPTGATVENDQDFWVPLTQGFYLKVSFGEDPQAIVSNLQLVLGSDALAGKESELEYVDLRFGDRVYYKLQGTDETSTPTK